VSAFIRLSPWLGFDMEKSTHATSGGEDKSAERAFRFANRSNDLEAIVALPGPFRYFEK
jgi:hypothetical protein